MVKLRSGQELTSDDQETAIASICGAAMAFRELREHSPVLTPTANNLLQLLDEDLREPEETLTR